MKVARCGIITSQKVTLNKPEWTDETGQEAEVADTRTLMLKV